MYRRPTMHRILPLFLALALHYPLAHASQPAAELLRDGDFERCTLGVGGKDRPGEWIVYGLTVRDISVAIVDGAGRSGSRGLRYHRTQAAKANVHVDQIVPVEKNTIYEVSAWVRGEGDPKLRPVLAVMRMDWKPLCVTVCESGSTWSEVRVTFNSFDNERVRLEWFPGAEGRLYTALPGASCLDDVSLRAVANPPEDLRRAFEVTRPKAAEEMSLAQGSTGPIGDPCPLRSIVCRKGVLEYEDGGEVALWGVNLQTPLSWEYHGRLKPSGVAMEAGALKRTTEESLSELKLMKNRIVRVHLLPADFADREGNLVDTVFLDVLDHLIDQCRQRGVYVYLTLVNEMLSPRANESFMNGQDRHRWLFDEPFVARMERYIQALLSHRNRYSGRAYRDEPAIAVFEVINEPGYLDYTAVVGDPQFREAFDRWCAGRGVEEHREVYFHVYRYELVRSVVDRLAKTIRDTGSRKPVVWNLNWPQMILQNEDVYQAVADSTVDAVSFCCYPGQGDVPHPYWDHPMDLSGRNYLPYLRDCYANYHALRWLLSQRFASKAKVTYEFETFYNQSSYLYPAMASLFRSLGSQMAMMWQYTLPPAAKFCGGSHYLNLKGSPQKALSFRIASQVFAELPRFAPYDVQAETEMAFGHATILQPRNISVYQSDESLVYTGPVETLPPVGPRIREIAGYGRSPVVDYDGSGAYFVRVKEDRLEVEILPDVSHPWPLWKRPGRPPWTTTCCEFDDKTPHRFAIHLPGWEGKLAMKGGKMRADGAFEITPGRYSIVPVQDSRHGRRNED